MTTDPSGRCRVVLGPSAHVLRRRVGAVAWMVLEEMLEHSESDTAGNGRAAAVSVRSLAVSLGIAKDTVHRAVTRLRDLGVIEARQARTAAGSFAAGGYLLEIPAACLSILEAPSPGASAPRSEARPRAAARSRVSDQLSLLLET